jgi:hypothetical protein
MDVPLLVHVTTNHMLLHNATTNMNFAMSIWLFFFQSATEQ